MLQSGTREAVALARDDKLTLIAISALACILQDLLHEGLGHGVTAWLSGAHRITMSTVALQSDIDTRWISANGTLVNLLFGAIFWLLLRNPQRYRPATRYFLILAMAGNLFTGTGYFLFSGVANFGDWAAVIRGLEPHWTWRLALVIVGVASYYASMLIVAAQLQAFRGLNADSKRLRDVSWTPYFTDGILAGVAGLLNPAGFFYVVASALPSTLGANAGLLSLPSMMRGRSGDKTQAGRIDRSVPWILTAGIASLLFIFVLGRGLTWSR
ncbi:MAG: hypothetical protein JOZ62_03035 [Acidobacteriaceae bacterium]|nr:hypothetical protein [Acidobacteriaceae bacterium]